MAKNVRVEILKNVATLGTNKNDWTKELNFVSWGGNTPKFDIREWNPGHTQMGKGATFTADELTSLQEAIKDLDITDVVDSVDIEE